MSSPCVTTARIPVTGEGHVRVIIWIGLILTCGTKCTNDVVIVGCTVAVFNDDPDTCVTVGISGMLTDLEQLVIVAVQEGSGHDVISLVHLGLYVVDGSETVQRCVCQTTKVNHGRVGR